MKLYRILILTLCAYTLSSCGGAEERKAVYMEKAKSSIEAGDLDKARIELKNVLQIDPKDGEAYYLIGKVYEQKREYRKAYSNYLKAEELSPELLGNQARLGRIYLLLINDSDKAQEKIDLILSSDPSNSEGLLLKAAMLLKNKNKTGAIGIAQDVVAREPGHVEGVVFLVSLYVSDNKSEDAIKLLDSALKTNHDNEKLNNLLALVLVNNKQYERAEIIYKHFLERNPDNRASYNNLAAFYKLTDNKDKAEEMLRKSIINDPDDVDRQLLLVQYIREVKTDDEAINELKQLVVKNVGIGKLRTALAELLYINGNKQAAIDTYKEAISDFSEEVTGVNSRISLATIYIKKEDFVRANKVLDEAINISPNDPKVNYLRARLALNDKDIEKAIISLRIVTKETPENIDAYFLLVNAYQKEGNEEQVKNTLNNAYENNKMNSEALLKLATYHMNSDIEESEKIINHYNSIKEADYNGLSLKASILNQKELYGEAHKLAETLMELFPNYPNGFLQAMPYYQQKRDINGAVSILEKGYVTSKVNRKILDLLTVLNVSEKKFDIAEKRLKAELNASPDDIELKLLLARVYLASNNTDSGENILKEVIENNSSNENPYLLLSLSYENRGERDSAKSTLLKGKNNVISSTKIPFKLAAMYEQDADYDSAINIYRDMYKSSPDNLVVLNNLASMLSDHGNNKADLELASLIIQKLKESSQPIFKDTIGWVYYKLGDYQNAIVYLDEVVKLMPNVNVFNYHLGMAYKMEGNNSQAKVYLEKSLADKKSFSQKDLAEAALKEL